MKNILISNGEGKMNYELVRNKLISPLVFEFCSKIHNNAIDAEELLWLLFRGRI